MALTEYRFTGTASTLGGDALPRPGFAEYAQTLPLAGRLSLEAFATSADALPAVVSIEKPARTAYAIAKRVLDVALAGTLLLILTPVLLLVACAIWAEDRGPILFCQDRTGKNGNAFRFLKFRSMVPNADALQASLASRNEATGPIFKMRNDPRITRVGQWIRKYSLDELPQLLHVVRGEMSLVGPRPLPVAEAARCDAARHEVPPGLICFREVGGRSRLTFDRWMELDRLYIERRSLRTDLGILRRALPAVLKGDGAY